MNKKRKISLDGLQERLGYTFNDLNLLIQGITHKSYINENSSEGLADYERLEFLGDVVLSLVVSDYLYNKLPDSDEGDLSKIRAGLVSESSLAQIAKELDIGKCLLLGRGEEITGGRNKNSLLANALEAIIAAIYKDTGYDRTADILLRLLENKIMGIEGKGFFRDYKSELQELVQIKNNTIPSYRIIQESGPDHEKLFEMEAVINGKLSGRGAGKSKKEAEQMAARDILGKLAKEGK